MRTLKTTRQIKGFETESKPAKEIDWSKKGKPIVAVDFDGTLVKNKYPYCENPNMELIKFIKSHKKDFIWVLWTNRHGIQLKFALEYLKREHQLEFDLVNENAPWLIEEYGDTRKVYADYYIDDRNVLVNQFKEVLKKAGE